MRLMLEKLMNYINNAEAIVIGAGYKEIIPQKYLDEAYNLGKNL